MKKLYHNFSSIKNNNIYNFNQHKNQLSKKSSYIFNKS
ncbi:hypothetical protein Bint_2155 [Brachyspira intermedia PWS/A]|uniref:Uncharacterized protein n=1 Tax=Brachyspira intermedia (strain ATCC 51140 / PWS/A) TaxID=1045858 RepID=G0ELJ0_BRAIP|nr:hypothetical protein Bint_2155 [Brachyspira intermedia PWS/A]